MSITINGRESHQASPDLRWTARLHLGSRLAAVSVSALGGFVLAGWFFDMAVLKSVLPGWVTMKPNTALAFVLAGISLRLACRQSGGTAAAARLLWSPLLAGGVVIFGLLTVLQYVFGWELGIDELLHEEVSAAAGTSHPGRMAPATAISFLLVGLALLVLDVSTKRGRRPAQFLILPSLLIALLALIGYQYGAQGLYQVPPFTAMALHTSIGLLLISVGILLARPAEGWMRAFVNHGAHGVIARRMVPAAVLIPIAIGHLRIQGQQAGLYGTEFGIALMVALMVVVFLGLAWWTADSLHAADMERSHAETALVKSEERFRVSFDQAAVESNELLAKANAELRLEIEQRQQTEAALRQSEERYRHIFDAVPVSIWEEDWSEVIGAVERLRQQGVSDFHAHFQAHPEQALDLLRRVRVLDVNPETLTMFAASDKAELLRSLEIVFATPDTLPGFIGELAALGAGKPIHRAEMTLRTVPGDLINALLTMFFPAPSSPSTKVLVSVMDITARCHAEDQLQKLNETLEQRVLERTAELEAFSYSVSHDLRAPLRAVDGFAHILVEEYGPKLDAEGRRVLMVIRNETKRMGQLIDDLLAFSRMGRQQFEGVEIDMSALVRSVWLELTSQNSNGSARFELQPLPPARGDRAMLRQVWINLLANALKFTRPQKIPAIEVGAELDSGEVVYFVKDNGVGFDEKYKHKLFGVFQRLHSEEEFEGSGVGLALVHRIVQRHGGRVWGMGKPEEGATFYFSLPQPTPPATTTAQTL